MNGVRSAAVLLLLFAVGCAEVPRPLPQRPKVATAGGIGDPVDNIAGRSVGFADGGLVVVVNPGVSVRSTGALLADRERGGIGLHVGARATRTDATGLAVLDDLPVGTAVIEFDPGRIQVSIAGEGLADAVVTYDPGLGAALVRSVFYPRSGPGVIALEDGVHHGSMILAQDGAVLVGRINQRGEAASIIDGDLLITGADVHVRNVVVTGRVVILGQGATVAFSELARVEIRANEVMLLRNVLETPPVVDGHNALVLDTVVR